MANLMAVEKLIHMPLFSETYLKDVFFTSKKRRLFELLSVHMEVKITITTFLISAPGDDIIRSQEPQTPLGGDNSHT